MAKRKREEFQLQHESWRVTTGGATPQTLLVLGFLGIAGFFLFTEHRAHLFGLLPWVLLLLCPLMHVFMHRGHDHGAAGRHDPDSAHQNREDKA